MAITINGKTYRNLQEQVEENVKDIEDLQESQFSGDYNDLSNKPFIPTKTSDLINDSFVTLATAQTISGAKTFSKSDGTAGTVAVNSSIPGLVTNIIGNNPNIVIRENNSELATVYDSTGIYHYSTNTDNDFKLWVNPSMYTFSRYKSGYVATTGDIASYVSGESTDGTYWTSLKIGNVTRGIPGLAYHGGYGITVSGNEISVNSGVVALQTDLPTYTSQLTNDSGFITGITSTDVITALGYTPLNTAAEILYQFDLTMQYNYYDDSNNLCSAVVQMHRNFTSYRQNIETWATPYTAMGDVIKWVCYGGNQTWIVNNVTDITGTSSLKEHDVVVMDLGEISVDSTSVLGWSPWLMCNGKAKQVNAVSTSLAITYMSHWFQPMQ